MIGDEPIRLLMRDQTPLVKFRDQIISHLWTLCQECQGLTYPAYVKEFAEISNFLWKGMSFRVIDQIADFQKNYTDQVKKEKNSQADLFPYRLTDYKLFDVSVMHDPRLIEGLLHFFVYQCATGLPYRVVCPFPYTSLSTFVHYQVLPVQNPS